MDKYQITLSLTASGKGEYLQIISEDGFAVNIVLIGEFTLNDVRESAREGKGESDGN